MNDSLKATQAAVAEAGFATYPRPWLIATAKRLGHDGEYSDYLAWESWMEEQVDRPCSMQERHPDIECQCGNCSLYRAWDELDHISRPFLYSIMADACRATAEGCGWKEE